MEVDFFPFFFIFLCLVSVPSMTLALTCLRWITLVHTYVLFCASRSWFLDMQFFWPTFPVSCHITLVYIRGVLLLVLMLLWFDGVSYVLSICSYVLDRCSGWVPMHFGEIYHLPYRHSSFHSYFGCSLLFQRRFYKSVVFF